MSKAFTKEDDAGGVTLPPASSFVVPSGPFHLTALGAAKLSAKADPKIHDLLTRAEILRAIGDRPLRATMGVTVHVETGSGEKKCYRLVSSEEQGLLGEGCSVSSPLGRALLGKEVGDVCEVRTPRGVDELEIVALEGEKDA